ncbi:WXG100 family type VII secretion target [Streptacidiphilus sp. N1-12]|uniref:WXG100 family type VII secretion target n=2 Tax=Streptacidiphilus alkalitolerans TaxID=3342712 RepID=A0ABV6V902_9ACTN
MLSDDSGDGWAAKTDFEKHTHADLLKMVAGADPTTVLGVGQSLEDASTHIQTLADDLAQHVNGLKWDSESGDTFKTWARQVVSATDTLAIYTSNTSVAIKMAGETLSSTKLPEIPEGPHATVQKYLSQFGAQSVIGADGTPKVAKPLFTTTSLVTPTGTLPNPNLVTQQDAYKAQTQLDSAHQEAIGQMEKLGGSYVGAYQTLGVSTVPDFPATPTTLMPPQGSGVQAHSSNVSVGGGSGGGTGGGSGTVKTVKGSGSVKSSTGDGSTGGTTVTTVKPPGTGGDTGGGTTTIQGTTQPTSGVDPNNPIPGGGNGNGGGTGGGTGNGGGTVITPIAGGGPGGTGGEGGPGGTGKVGGGGSGEGSGPRPGGGGESGIHGGLPGAAGGRNGAGRVNAIGAEGEGAAGLGRGGGIGGAGSTASLRAGSSRLGGGAGAEAMAESSAGSSTARSGLGATAERGAAGSSEAGHSGMTPMGGGGMGGAGSRGGGGRRKGRAAYLVEDEDTWAPGDADANPAVIQ